MRRFELTRKDFSYSYDVATRWKDMDSYGHVNNATYLTYFEDARITMIKKWKLNSKSLIVASIKVDYLSQIKHPAKLEVCAKVSRVGGSSFDILSYIFEEGSDKPVAASTIVVVCFDYERQKPIRIFPQILEEVKE